MAKPNTTRIQDQIWYELEQAKCALTKETICRKIDCSIHSFDVEKKALLQTGELYFCQDGFILKEYATYDQQLWHLSWALGLLETSSYQVVVDEELLQLAPRAIQSLIGQGRMDETHKRRLSELKTKLISAMVAPKLLLQTYNKVQAILDEKLEPKGIGDGKTKLKDFKDLKKYKKDFE